ncbi:MAG: hypothetical protein ABSH06_25375 [Thermodesulfobacteriota bacterium]|jgi:hypothetical protein
MNSQRIQALLESAYPKEIVSHIVKSFSEVEAGFRIEKWKNSELDAGHFVEAVRRLIEHQLQGRYTSFANSISAFSQTVLNKYESCAGPEEYRILIPRLLYSMYCIRNKRGVGHISAISPNKLDATYILHAAKWVLAELVRLAGVSSPEEAKQLTDQVLERKVDLIWEDDETFMVLDKKLKTRERILLCLYKHDRLPMEDLRLKVGYKNKTHFIRIIANLEHEKLMALTSVGICKLSPLGVKAAERLISGT